MSRPLPGCILCHLLYQGRTTSVWFGRIVGSDSPVAIKRANDPTDRATAARLGDEAARGSAVEHPGLLRPVAVVDDPPGLAIVYPYIAGGSLRSLLDQRGALGAGELVAVLEPVAAALAALGRPHGDLKPDNVLLRLDGSPVVGDTAPAHGWTPAYRAPELDRADAPTVSGDVYSLGVLAYEALAGRRPHRGSAAEVRALAAAGARRSLHTWSGVDEPVARVIERALAADPAERPATPERFAAELASVVDPATVRAARPIASAEPIVVRGDDTTLDFGPGPPAPEPEVDRRRWIPAAAAAVGAVVVAGATALGPSEPVPTCPAVVATSDVVGVDLDGDGCNEPARWDGRVLAPLDPASTTPDLRVGGPGTQVRFGDWDGDGAVTVAAYEPSTGVVRYLDRLDRPDRERREPAPRSGRAEVVSDADGDRLVVHRR